jgi:hypothetical protein
VGDKDDFQYLTKRGADWRADSYTHTPGPKDLLTVVGGEHWLGGISGYDAAETTDESPERREGGGGAENDGGLVEGCFGGWGCVG